MKILEGTTLANKILKDVKVKVSKMKVKPKLLVISVGDDESSKVYIEKKQEKAMEVGMDFTHFHFKKTTTEYIVKMLRQFSKEKTFDAIVIQHPLPSYLNKREIIEAVCKCQDVDGLKALNKGMLIVNEPKVIPPTALGIFELLNYYKINIEGKHVVLVGTSEVVGIPLSSIFLNNKATVTLCNLNTLDLNKHTKQADILVVATGKKNLIKGKDVKKGSIVISVGITRENGKVYGDIDFDSVSNVASAVTPTPGGVGPLTVAVLLRNVLICQQMVKDK